MQAAQMKWLLLGFVIVATRQLKDTNFLMLICMKESLQIHTFILKEK